MHYEEAKQAFRENLNLIQAPERDMLSWNLNAGLTALTSSVQGDLHRIADLLEQILSELQRRPK